jgi:hypothetical protein
VIILLPLCGTQPLFLSCTSNAIATISQELTLLTRKPGVQSYKLLFYYALYNLLQSWCWLNSFSPLLPNVSWLNIFSL